MANEGSTRINSPVRIAIVGCGRVSSNHIKAILKYSDQAVIEAFCDTKKERIEQAKILISKYSDICKNKSSPKEYYDYADLIFDIKALDIKIDLIVLCTPSGLHSIQTIQAAQAGVNICTEKPMATRWEDGLSMVNACDLNGVRLFVVKQNRFNPTIRLVKKHLLSGRFGRLALVTANVFWQRPQSYYDQDEWRGTWEFDGGALMNQASHYVDLLDWLVGPVETVSASIATIGRSIEVEDTAALQLKWRNGALGTMAVTMLTYPKNLEGSITLLGEKGTVRIGGNSVNKIELWDFYDDHEDDKIVEEANYQPSNIYGYGHYPYYEDILRALKDNIKALCDGKEGLRSLELLIGAYRSAKEGVSINLPLEK